MCVDIWYRDQRGARLASSQTTGSQMLLGLAVRVPRCRECPAICQWTGAPGFAEPNTVLSI